MFESLRKFFAFCNEENRRKYYLAVFLSVLDSMFTATKIPAAWVAIKALLAGSVTAGTILLCLAIVLGGIFGKMLVNRFSVMLQTEAGYGTCAQKRIEIAEHLRYLPMGYFNANSLGHITSVTTNTMEQVGDVATRAIMLTLQGSISAVIIDIMMLAFDWRIGLISSAAMLLFFFISGLSRATAKRLSSLKLQSDKKLVGSVLEFVQGIFEVKNYNLIAGTGTRLERDIEEKRRNDTRTELSMIPLVGVQGLFLKLAGTAIVAAAISFYLGGTMELSDAITMLLCSFLVFEGLESAGIYASLLRAIENGVDLANEILALPQMDIDGEEISPEKLDIKMEGVEFAYENRKIIDGISLSIPERTTTAIVGPSGGGKTTVTSLMARFWDVQAGSVSLGGRNVKDYSFDSLMKNFSFVFQRVYLFEDTIANNIRFSRPDAPMEDVIRAAKAACCHEFITALPDGYETKIGEGGASLSGGEKQRVAIARAILKDSPIIILDEATANVDPENEMELTQAMENLTKEKTVIMIAHRLKTVRGANQIVVIDHGKIVQQGNHRTLCAQEGIYRRFVSDRRQAVSWKITADR